MRGVMWSRGWAIAGLLAVLATSGCSGGSDPTSSSGRSSPAVSASSTPSTGSGDGDLRALLVAVHAEVSTLRSVHVEQRYGADDDTSLSFDVDEGGRCSGTRREAGDPALYRFVTTLDLRYFITTSDGEHGDQLAGRWIEDSESLLPHFCANGARGVLLSSARSEDTGWFLEDVDSVEKVGVERINGVRVVHFRQPMEWGTFDTWVGADPETTRVLKIVRTSTQGDQTTLEFSRFNAPMSITPVPPPDALISAPESGGTNSTVAFLA
jgi:hypothetical protein